MTDYPARRGDAEGRAGRRAPRRHDAGLPGLRGPRVHGRPAGGARKDSKATGVRYDQLFIRHWDAWEDGTLSTLFTAVVGRGRQGRRRRQRVGQGARPRSVEAVRRRRGVRLQPRRQAARVQRQARGSHRALVDELRSLRGRRRTARRRPSISRRTIPPGTRSPCSSPTATSPGSRRSGRDSSRTASTSWCATRAPARRARSRRPGTAPSAGSAQRVTAAACSPRRTTSGRPRCYSIDARSGQADEDRRLRARWRSSRPRRPAS